MKTRISVLLVTILLLLIPQSIAFAEGEEEQYVPGGCAFYSLGLCVPSTISSESWWTPAPQHIVGKAVWYAPGIMEATARYRGMSFDGFVGGVSLMSPADIGETVWLKRPGYGWEGPFLVVDCAARQDFWVVVSEIKEVVEVDFETAKRWGMVEGDWRGYSVNAWMTKDVEVYKGVMPPIEDSEAIVYDEFLRETVEWGGGWYRNWTQSDTDALFVVDFDEYVWELTTALDMSNESAYEHASYVKFGYMLENDRENGVQNEPGTPVSDFDVTDVENDVEMLETALDTEVGQPQLSCPLSGCVDGGAGGDKRNGPHNG